MPSEELARRALTACPRQWGLRALHPFVLSGDRVAYLFQPWRRSPSGALEGTSPIGVVELSPRAGDILAVRPLSREHPWRALFARGAHNLSACVKDCDDIDRARVTVHRLQHVAWSVYAGDAAPAAHHVEIHDFANAWWSTLALYEAEAQRVLAPGFWRWVADLDSPSWP